MISSDYVRLMAAYTAWQNASICAAADSLDDEARRLDRGAFFRSIHATLSHLLWGDQTWLHRLAQTPAPAVSDITGSVHLYRDWQELKQAREATDRAIIHWAGQITDGDLEGNLDWYSGSRGARVVRPRWALVVQLFNHGTHHRGQAHAMLTAAGAQPDDTDIQYLNDPRFPWPAP